MKSILQFSKNACRSDGLSGQCKNCHKILRRGHYQANRERVYGQIKERRKVLNTWISTYKELHPCKDCGLRYKHYQMDFDHLRDKKWNISRIVKHTGGLEPIKAEIAKCDLVCANCHRERTHQRQRQCAGSSMAEH